MNDDSKKGTFVMNCKECGLMLADFDFHKRKATCPSCGHENTKPRRKKSG